jgi:hypothetical protein
MEFDRPPADTPPASAQPYITPILRVERELPPVRQTNATERPPMIIPPPHRHAQDRIPAEQSCAGQAHAFLEACHAQGVQPSHQFDKLINADSYTAGCRPVGAAIMGAASVLNYGDPLLDMRFDKPQPYVNTPLNIENLPDDMPTRLLGRLINAHAGFTPELPAEQQWPAATVPLGVCRDAEDYWSETYLGMRDPSAQTPDVQIFTRDTEPVILRKGRGNATGLLLASMALGNHGIVYPPGSIVQLKTDNDDKHLELGWLNTPSTGVLITPFKKITRINFSRLSAIALPKPDRARHFYEQGKTPLNDIPTHEEMTEAAAKLLRQHRSSWLTRMRIRPARKQ